MAGSHRITLSVMVALAAKLSKMMEDTAANVARESVCRHNIFVPLIFKEQNLASLSRSGHSLRGSMSSRLRNVPRRTDGLQGGIR